jgi:SAM-dependent methyltransferase
VPELDTSLHLDMLHDFRERQIPLWLAAKRGYASREELERAVASGELSVEKKDGVRMLRLEDLHRLYGERQSSDETYGSQWGDPDLIPPLRFIKNRYLLPLVSEDKVGVEIGPGGGRWTRHLTRLKRLYAVDYHQKLLDELARTIRGPNIIPVKNDGTNFPGIDDNEIDLLFSFGVFVHLDLPIVEQYLAEMRRILKPGASALIQYSDKRKIMAAVNSAFAENSPETMRKLVVDQGYRIVLEDTTTLWHSSLVLFIKD